MIEKKLIVLKKATMGDLIFQLFAMVDEGTKYDDKGKPISGFSEVLRITSEGICAHHSVVSVMEMVLTDTTGADKVAKFFLDIDSTEK